MSDDMACYSPEFIAAVRRNYEDSDKSLARIATDHGISERTVNRMRDRERWARRSERVRDMPPAMQALQEATKLLAERTPADGTPTPSTFDPHPNPPLFKGREQAELAAATMRESGSPHAERERAATIARIERLVERELEAEEAARATLGPLPRAPADAERCARTLATLTQTLHALARLRSGVLPDNGPADDDMPKDIDEFRRELARRIHAFVDGRTGGKLHDGVPGGDAQAGGA